jgi:hypothetical protein
MAARRKSEVINPIGPSSRVAQTIVSTGSGGKEWILRKILSSNYDLDQILVCSLDHPIGPNPSTNPVVARWIKDQTGIEPGLGAGAKVYTFDIGDLPNIGTGSYFPPGHLAGPNHPEDYIFSITDGNIGGGGVAKVKIQKDGSAVVVLDPDNMFVLGSTGITYGAAGTPGRVVITTNGNQPDLSASSWDVDQAWVVDSNNLLQSYGFSSSLSDAGTLFDHARKVVIVTKNMSAHLVTDTIVFSSDIQALKLQVAVLCTPAAHWKDNLTVEICTGLGDPASGTWDPISTEVDTDLVGNTILYRFKHDQILAIKGAGAAYALTISFSFDNTPQRVVDTLVLGYAIGLAP